MLIPKADRKKIHEYLFKEGVSNRAVRGSQQTLTTQGTRGQEGLQPAQAWRHRCQKPLRTF